MAGENTQRPPARTENYCESKQTYFSYILDKAFHNLPQFWAKLFFTRNWVGGFYWDSLLKIMITHNKTIKWRIKIINSNIDSSHCKFGGLSEVRTDWLYRWFWKFFNVFAESPLLPCILHRNRLFLLNSPDIMEFSSWKRFIIRSIP